TPDARPLARTFLDVGVLRAEQAAHQHFTAGGGTDRFGSNGYPGCTIGRPPADGSVRYPAALVAARFEIPPAPHGRSRRTSPSPPRPRPATSRRRSSKHLLATQVCLPCTPHEARANTAAITFHRFCD